MPGWSADSARMTRTRLPCDSHLMSSEIAAGPARSRAGIAANMARFDRVESAGTGLRAASVAVCVVGAPDRLSLLLTRRAPRLRSHAGQWALPGGSRDPGESVEDAALRELAEETGVELGPDAVLGLLDDYATRSGYLISPVVVWGGPVSPAMRRQASEVAQIHVIPLADFDVEPQLLRIPESEFPVIRLPLLGRYLHAPTAAIVYQFCRAGLHGEPVRVAHLEQPVFAWK